MTILSQKIHELDLALKMKLSPAAYKIADQYLQSIIKLVNEADKPAPAATPDEPRYTMTAAKHLQNGDRIGKYVAGKYAPYGKVDRIGIDGRLAIVIVDNGVDLLNLRGNVDEIWYVEPKDDPKPAPARAADDAKLTKAQRKALAEFDHPDGLVIDYPSGGGEPNPDGDVTRSMFYKLNALKVIEMVTEDVEIVRGFGGKVWRRYYYTVSEAGRAALKASER